MGAKTHRSELSTNRMMNGIFPDRHPDWLVGERIDEFDGRHYELLHDSARYLAGE